MQHGGVSISRAGFSGGKPPGWRSAFPTADDDAGFREGTGICENFHENDVMTAAHGDAVLSSDDKKNQIFLEKYLH